MNATMDGTPTFQETNEDVFEIAFRHVKASANRWWKEHDDKYHLKCDTDAVVKR